MLYHWVNGFPTFRDNRVVIFFKGQNVTEQIPQHRHENLRSCTGLGKPSCFFTSVVLILIGADYSIWNGISVLPSIS
jgi:hypothetical protein